MAGQNLLFEIMVVSQMSVECSCCVKCLITVRSRTRNCVHHRGTACFLQVMAPIIEFLLTSRWLVRVAVVMDGNVFVVTSAAVCRKVDIVACRRFFQINGTVLLINNVFNILNFHWIIVLQQNDSKTMITITIIMSIVVTNTTTKSSSPNCHLVLLPT